MNAIEIRNLSKSFRGMYAVDHLNMTVPVGAIYGFIGENGSGKSTTEKLVCGHLVPNGGEIKLFGRDYRDAGVRVRVGALIENTGCFPNSSVWDNLMMQAINLGLGDRTGEEESRSISENVTWGKRKQFADGKVSLAYSSFLGYRKGEDGQMEIVPEEADTVRLIYRLFMQGQTPYAIAKYLTDRNIPTPTGKETWRHRTVENILSNEKYKGDARLQKCYTVDFLSKKRKANEGEVPQYYVEGSHDAIIAPAEWQLVQTEIQRRKNTGRSHNCCSPFSAKLKCGDCGEYFGSKVWHSNSKYKRTIWQCNAKFKGESRCATPHLYEQRIKELFLEALGILMENRETVIADCRAVMEVLADCGPIDAEMEAVSDEMEVTAGLIQKLVDENATRKLDQHDYRKKYDGYASRYAALESRMDSLEKERERKEIQYDIFSGFLAGLSETAELPVDFNEKLFTGLWITQRSIRTAGWFLPSATGWRSAQRFKAGSGRGIGFVLDAFGRFFCEWKRLPFIMEKGRGFW